MPTKTHIIVIGAGAFGGWTALNLRRQGAHVTLLDAWGPGNTRASSGGETRVIRGMYGPDPVYTQWVAEALLLWKEANRQWCRHLYQKAGALWMFRIKDDHYARTALPLLNEAGLPAYEWPLEVARRHFPQINFEGIHSVFYEEEAGYLLAREACSAVCEAFIAEGGTYHQTYIQPQTIQKGRLESIRLSDGSTLRADTYIFACGPWLGTLFPDVLGDLIRPTRQPILYFETPAHDFSFHDDQFPVWVEFGERVLYGIPNGSTQRGFKIGDDTRGMPFDPTHDERRLHDKDLVPIRSCLARRFPALHNAPLLEARICQYANSPDGNLIIDRHPKAENVWLVGGGSGHGFKLGPAIGTYVAGLVLGGKDLIPLFGLDRFEGPANHSTQFEHYKGSLIY